MWKPNTRSGHDLPDALKFVLRDKMGLMEGERIFDHGNISYLSGLRDAGVEGAQELIDAIEKHDEVVVWLQY